ncbi:MAG TPA: efflux RND transporter periplasmic adaptor subunit, partial [Acidobacteriota bacterium]
MNRNLLRVVLAVVVAAGVAVAFLAGRMSVPAITDMGAIQEAGPATADENAGRDMGAMTAAEPESKTAGGQVAGSEGIADMARPAASADQPMPADAVMITPERQQLIGIRTARVERRSLDRTIRTVGVVGYNERRVAHIHTKVTGWIESLQVDSTGELVEQGQQLLEIYSPQLLSTQEEYLLALRGRASLGDS